MNGEPTINQVDKLDEALALLAAGLALEEVLVEAGDDAAWLRPMLTLAAEVDALKADIPVPAPQSSLDRLLAHANSLAAPTSSPSPRRPGRAVSRPWFDFGRLLFNTGLSTAIAAVLLCLVCVFGSLLGGGMVLAAEGSLPGQPLYPVKRLGETIRLTLTQDTRQRQQLEEIFNQRRVEEVNHLIEQRKAAPVRLIGRVEAISETWLTVDALTIELAPETITNGELAVGAQVRLEGQTNAAGQLVATSITVLEPAPPTPTPTVTPTPMPPTSTPIPTATATPLPPTATPTAASQSTSDTIKLAPTATPKPAPVEVETDDAGARSDNSGPGSNNSGPGNGDSPEDNSGPGSGLDENNTHIGDDNSGPGSNNDNSEDNSGPGSNNSGSSDNNNDRDDHSGSGGGGDRDDNSGKSGGKDDKGGDDD